MPSSPLILPQYAVHSERGGSHTENEDVAIAIPHPNAPELLLCVLADGQGGRSGGAQAAHTAAHSVLSLASQTPASRLRGRILHKYTWPAILSGADDAAMETSGDGYTTLIGLCVASRFVAGASCGDSGVLLVPKPGVKTEPAWLTENQRKNPPVGSGAAHPVSFSARLAPGDTLLVMSDGAFRYGDAGEVANACLSATGEQIIAALRALQTGTNRSRELSDDFSVLVVHV